MTNRYEVHEEFRTSRSRHRAPSPPDADRAERGYAPPHPGYDAEFYPGGTPIHVIETEGVGPMPPGLASGAIPPPPIGGHHHHHHHAGALELPPSRSRPRSVPAFNQAIVQTRPQRRRHRSPSTPRSRSRSRSPSLDWYERERERDRLRAEAAKTPAEKAGEVLKDKFSHSTAGLGVGLLGAAVGAWVASEASDAHGRYRTGKEMEEAYKNPNYRPPSPRRRDSNGGGGGGSSSSNNNNNKAKIALTVLGAVVGGLGANAIERRVQDARERDLHRREAWDRRWRNDKDNHYDSDEYYTSGDEGRRGGATKEIEVRTRGRRVRRGNDAEYEEEDYVYEERRPRQRRSGSQYRY
jgi:hypothetical protein